MNAPFTARCHGRQANPVTFCHILNTRSTAATRTCTAPSSNCITSHTSFSLSRAFSPCSSTSSHNLISLARLWYTLFVAETSVELKGTHKVIWQLTIFHWQGNFTHSTLTLTCVHWGHTTWALRGLSSQSPELLCHYLVTFPAFSLLPHHGNASGRTAPVQANLHITSSRHNTPSAPWSGQQYRYIYTHIPLWHK